MTFGGSIKMHFPWTVFYICFSLTSLEIYPPITMGSKYIQFTSSDIGSSRKRKTRSFNDNSSEKGDYSNPVGHFSFC